MAPQLRYAVTLPGPVGAHGAAKVVVVQLLHDGGGVGPVWGDTGGLWRMRIDGEAAIVLRAPSGYEGRQLCLHAVLLA
ncbi:DUF6296 family protein [Kitasatospora purpeofusca]|uniref:DUF6296 family protein n=1 Tax=Kitasatospora purpeofusca TaxID=67352 RepID=UPI002A59E6E5|nr:DUF6296 family protein [Kitasatospora purpeofusca]MDY0810855.1 DUF6296 family protein [Kitasatospora purpeofusca]